MNRGPPDIEEFPNSLRLVKHNSLSYLLNPNNKGRGI